MNVLFVSAEVTPYSKAGGLADVAGSLPKALNKYVASIHVITPLYGVIDQVEHNIIHTAYKGAVKLGSDVYPYDIYTTAHTDGGEQTWFIHNEQFFARDGIYTESNGTGYEDNNLRYFFFQLVVLDLLKRKIIDVDILHCNDHHTGLLPALIKAENLSTVTIFTIHNFLYHGHFSRTEMEGLPCDVHTYFKATQWGNYSALLEGITHSDWVTTVSPGYAKELLQGENLDENSHTCLLQAKGKFQGIVNGIDTDYWDPESDIFNPAHFSKADMAGKIVNKLSLQKKMGLKQNGHIPLIGSISRLVENKGFPLIVEILDKFTSLGVQFVFLGSGDPAIAEQLQAASQKHPNQIAFDSSFNEPLAHLIEAGSDMFLMPSRFEPCGLNQLYSLRYGTIPIVNKTGGLGDTVQNWDDDTGSGTGFVFDSYTVAKLDATLSEAVALYKDDREWAQLVQRAMQEDFSWDRSAKEYYRLYTKQK